MTKWKKNQDRKIDTNADKVHTDKPLMLGLEDYFLKKLYALRPLISSTTALFLMINMPLSLLVQAQPIQLQVEVLVVLTSKCWTSLAIFLHNQRLY
jgi:hypothetical protein